MTLSNTMSIGYTSRALYVCGDNAFGQLGLGENNNRKNFTLVKDLPSTIQQIAVGCTHVLALTSQGLYACGNNGYGQLRLGNNSNCMTFPSVACLPDELRQLLVLNRQLKALIVLHESNTHDTQQGLTLQKSLSNKRQKFR